MTPTHREADAETEHQEGQSRLSFLTNSALSEMLPELAYLAPRRCHLHESLNLTRQSDILMLIHILSA